MKKRTIALVADLKLREAPDGGESRTVEGYALKFGVRSRLLCDWWDYYYEVLEPGCVTREMLDKQDIKLTMFHDRQLILARSNQGTGTLNYEVDAVGVKFWAEMPRTVDGDKALELVQRGDIAGCSFCYSTDESDSENAVSYERIKEKTETGEDILLRHVKRIDNVYDFTLAADPAYEQTTVTRREVEDAGVNLSDDDPEPQPDPDKPAEGPNPEPDPEPQPEVDADKKRETIKALKREINAITRRLT